MNCGQNLILNSLGKYIMHYIYLSEDGAIFTHQDRLIEEHSFQEVVCPLSMPILHIYNLIWT